VNPGGWRPHGVTRSREVASLRSQSPTFADPERLYQEIDALDRKNLKDHTIRD